MSCSPRWRCRQTAGLTPAGFGVHPAVLDAALHAVIVAADGTTIAGAAEGSVMVPFSWQQVSLHAAGASAVRARIAPTGPSAGLDRAGRQPGVAGAVGDVDGRPAGDRTAAEGGAVRLGRGSAVRGGLVTGDAGHQPVPSRRTRSSSRNRSPMIPWPACMRRRTKHWPPVRSWLTERDTGGVGGGDAGRGGAARRGRHRFGGRGGVGAGALGADRASRPDRAGRYRRAPG